MPTPDDFLQHWARLEDATAQLLDDLTCPYSQFEQQCKRVWALSQEYISALREAAEQAPSEVAEAHRKEATTMELADFFFNALCRYRKRKGID